MSMAHLNEGLGLIGLHPDLAEFAGRRNEAVVVAAERALGGRLPPTYRAFVAALGAGNFGAFEIYGVIDDDFSDSSIPDGIWLTLHERRTNKLPPELLIIGSTGDGGEYCLELRDGAESPVTIRQPGHFGDVARAEVVASDFGEFLLDGVRGQLTGG